MDSSFDFYNLIVPLTGVILGNRLEIALKTKRKIDEFYVCFISGISVTIFTTLEQQSNLASVFITILSVACPFLFKERKYNLAMAIGFMIAVVVCMILGEGYLPLCISLCFLSMLLCVLYRKEIIGFFYNRIRFNSNDFDIISNFIYNSLIKKGK